MGEVDSSFWSDPHNYSNYYWKLSIWKDSDHRLSCDLILPYHCGISDSNIIWGKCVSSSSSHSKHGRHSNKNESILYAFPLPSGSNSIFDTAKSGSADSSVVHVVVELLHKTSNGVPVAQALARLAPGKQHHNMKSPSSGTTVQASTVPDEKTSPRQKSLRNALQSLAQARKLNEEKEWHGIVPLPTGLCQSISLAPQPSLTFTTFLSSLSSKSSLPINAAQAKAHSFWQTHKLPLFSFVASVHSSSSSLGHWVMKENFHLVPFLSYTPSPRDTLQYFLLSHPSLSAASSSSSSSPLSTSNLVSKDSISSLAMRQRLYVTVTDLQLVEDVLQMYSIHNIVVSAIGAQSKSANASHLSHISDDIENQNLLWNGEVMNCASYLGVISNMLGEWVSRAEIYPMQNGEIECLQIRASVTVSRSDGTSTSQKVTEAMPNWSLETQILCSGTITRSCFMNKSSDETPSGAANIIHPFKHSTVDGLSLSEDLLSRSTVKSKIDKILNVPPPHHNSPSHQGNSNGLLEAGHYEVLLKLHQLVDVHNSTPNGSTVHNTTTIESDIVIGKVTIKIEHSGDEIDNIQLRSNPSFHSQYFKLIRSLIDPQHPLPELSLMGLGDNRTDDYHSELDDNDSTFSSHDSDSDESDKFIGTHSQGKTKPETLIFGENNQMHNMNLKAFSLLTPTTCLACLAICAVRLVQEHDDTSISTLGRRVGPSDNEMITFKVIEKLVGTLTDTNLCDAESNGIMTSLLGNFHVPNDAMKAARYALWAISKQWLSGSDLQSLLRKANSLQYVDEPHKKPLSYLKNLPSAINLPSFSAATFSLPTAFLLSTSNVPNSDDDLSLSEKEWNGLRCTCACLLLLHKSTNAKLHHTSKFYPKTPQSDMDSHIHAITAQFSSHDWHTLTVDDASIAGVCEDLLHTILAYGIRAIYNILEDVFVAAKVSKSSNGSSQHIFEINQHLVSNLSNVVCRVSECSSFLFSTTEGMSIEISACLSGFVSAALHAHSLLVEDFNPNHQSNSGSGSSSAPSSNDPLRTPHHAQHTSKLIGILTSILSLLTHVIRCQPEENLQKMLHPTTAGHEKGDIVSHLRAFYSKAPPLWSASALGRDMQIFTEEESASAVNCENLSSAIILTSSYIAALPSLLGSNERKTNDGSIPTLDATLGNPRPVQLLQSALHDLTQVLSFSITRPLAKFDDQNNQHDSDKNHVSDAADNSFQHSNSPVHPHSRSRSSSPTPPPHARRKRGMHPQPPVHPSGSLQSTDFDSGVPPSSIPTLLSHASPVFHRISPLEQRLRELSSASTSSPSVIPAYSPPPTHPISHGSRNFFTVPGGVSEGDSSRIATPSHHRIPPRLLAGEEALVWLSERATFLEALHCCSKAAATLAFHSPNDFHENITTNTSPSAGHDLTNPASTHLTYVPPVLHTMMQSRVVVDAMCSAVMKGYHTTHDPPIASTIIKSLSIQGCISRGNVGDAIGSVGTEKDTVALRVGLNCINFLAHTVSVIGNHWLSIEGLVKTGLMDAKIKPDGERKMAASTSHQMHQQQQKKHLGHPSSSPFSTSTASFTIPTVLSANRQVLFASLQSDVALLESATEGLFMRAFYCPFLSFENTAIFMERQAKLKQRRKKAEEKRESQQNSASSSSFASTNPPLSSISTHSSTFSHPPDSFIIFSVEEALEGGPIIQWVRLWQQLIAAVSGVLQAATSPSLKQVLHHPSSYHAYVDLVLSLVGLLCDLSTLSPLLQPPPSSQSSRATKRKPHLSRYEQKQTRPDLVLFCIEGGGEGGEEERRYGASILGTLLSCAVCFDVTMSSNCHEDEAIGGPSMGSDNNVHDENKGDDHGKAGDQYSDATAKSINEACRTHLICACVKLMRLLSIDPDSNPFALTPQFFGLLDKLIFSTLPLTVLNGDEDTKQDTAAHSRPGNDKQLQSPSRTHSSSRPFTSSLHESSLGDVKSQSFLRKICPSLFVLLEDSKINVPTHPLHQSSTKVPLSDRILLNFFRSRARGHGGVGEWGIVGSLKIDRLTPHGCANTLLSTISLFLDIAFKSQQSASRWAGGIDFFQNGTTFSEPEEMDEGDDEKGEGLGIITTVHEAEKIKEIVVKLLHKLRVIRNYVVSSSYLYFTQSNHSNPIVGKGNSDDMRWKGVRERWALLNCVASLQALIPSDPSYLSQNHPEALSAADAIMKEIQILVNYANDRAKLNTVHLGIADLRYDNTSGQLHPLLAMECGANSLDLGLGIGNLHKGVERVDSVIFDPIKVCGRGYVAIQELYNMYIDSSQPPPPPSSSLVPQPVPLVTSSLIQALVPTSTPSLDEKSITIGRRAVNEAVKAGEWEVAGEIIDFLLEKYSPTSTALTPSPSTIPTAPRISSLISELKRAKDNVGDKTKTEALNRPFPVYYAVYFSVSPFELSSKSMSNVMHPLEFELKDFMAATSFSYVPTNSTSESKLRTKAKSNASSSPSLPSQASNTSSSTDDGGMWILLRFDASSMISCASLYDAYVKGEKEAKQAGDIICFEDRHPVFLPSVTHPSLSDHLSKAFPDFTLLNPQSHLHSHSFVDEQGTQDVHRHAHSFASLYEREEEVDGSVIDKDTGKDKGKGKGKGMEQEAVASTKFMQIFPAFPACMCEGEVGDMDGDDDDKNEEKKDEETVKKSKTREKGHDEDEYDHDDTGRRIRRKEKRKDNKASTEEDLQLKTEKAKAAEIAERARLKQKEKQERKKMDGWEEVAHSRCFYVFAFDADPGIARGGEGERGIGSRGKDVVQYVLSVERCDDEWLGRKTLKDIWDHHQVSSKDSSFTPAEHQLLNLFQESCWATPASIASVVHAHTLTPSEALMDVLRYEILHCKRMSRSLNSLSSLSATDLTNQPMNDIVSARTLLVSAISMLVNMTQQPSCSAVGVSTAAVIIAAEEERRELEWQDIRRKAKQQYMRKKLAYDEKYGELIKAAAAANSSNPPPPSNPPNPTSSSTPTPPPPPPDTSTHHTPLSKAFYGLTSHSHSHTHGKSKPIPPPPTEPNLVELENKLKKHQIPINDLSRARRECIECLEEAYLALRKACICLGFIPPLPKYAVSRSGQSNASKKDNDLNEISELDLAAEVADVDDGSRMDGQSGDDGGDSQHKEDVTSAMKKREELLQRAKEERERRQREREIEKRLAEQEAAALKAASETEEAIMWGQLLLWIDAHISALDFHNGLL